jgi:N6-L-threonylcarbamoyladenine synthase
MRCRPRLADPDLEFPICCCSSRAGIASCSKCAASGDYRRLATTIDDAAGEAFDKTAKLLGLGFPAARRSSGREAAIPRRCRCRGRCSARPSRISPLPGSRARCCARATPGRIACRGYRRLVPAGSGRLPGRSHAARDERDAALVVAGGVAANEAVRGALQALAAQHDLRFVAPPLWLCTDNAAMIGWAGASASPPG